MKYIVEIYSDDIKWYSTIYTLAQNWAKENCVSYIDCQCLDLSDCNMSFPADTLYTFTFTDESDAIWFKLKWQ